MPNLEKSNDLPILKQEDLKNVIRPITINKTEAVINGRPKKKSPGSMEFIA